MRCILDVVCVQTLCEVCLNVLCAQFRRVVNPLITTCKNTSTLIGPKVHGKLESVFELSRKEHGTTSSFCGCHLCLAKAEAKERRRKIVQSS